MNKTRLYSVSLVTSALVTTVGGLFKIEHWTGTQFILLLGMILTIPFVYLGIIDVFANNKNESLVKLMWVVGFIFLSWIAGFAYQGNFRKRNAE